MESKIKDDEMFDFLMTSDFDGDYSPTELKEFLKKWKYFFRLYNGKSDRLKDEFGQEILLLNNKIKELDKKLNEQILDNFNKEDTINKILSQKLTWKERLTGKLIRKS